MPLVETIIKNYMRHFPINEGKRSLFNGICHRLSVQKEVVLTKDGFKMELDPADSSQRHTFWYARYNEKDEVSTVLSLLAKGETFIDVGANIGYFTLIAACKVGSGGRVLSFEPSIYTFNVLKKNIDHNSYTQVELLQKAVGDRPDKLTLYTRSGFADDVASLIKNDSHDSSVKVEVTTIDAEVKKHAIEPSVIKIDAEGYDELVLRGAQRTLTGNNPPAIIVESFGNQTDTVLYLTDLGFIPYVLSKHLWSRMNPDDEATSNNTLWINKKKLAETEVRIKHILLR